MQNNLKYINLSWAVVGICEGSHLPLSALVHEGDDMEKTVEHYVIGYLAFWHIAFVDEKQLQPQALQGYYIDNTKQLMLF